MKTVAMLIAASFISAAAPAYAGPCSKEIEMVTGLLGGGGAASASSVGSAALGGATGAETLSAVNPAAGNPEALASVQQAQKADASGDEAGCMEYIGKAKQLLGLVQ